MSATVTSYAGISWSETGWEIETVDDLGRTTTPTRHFDVARTEQLISSLRAADPGQVVVVESTNGILDGRMMAAGLTVYRADPEHLVRRPHFGSVPAGLLARAAQRDLATLTRLERHRGTQTGREDALAEWIASASAETSVLTASGRCVWHGDRNAPLVALTFDDGPTPPYTGQVLDVLARYGVPATFFCVGAYARAYPDLVARIQEEGHSLGNHTYSHPFLPELTRAELTAQIERTAEALAEAGGGDVPRLFRPPYGARTPRVLDWLTTDAPTVALWDVAPDDWTMPGAAEISRLVLEQARPGSIVLLHDGGGDRSQTVAALPPMIEGLLARGYGLVPVENLPPVPTATVTSPARAAAPSPPVSPDASREIP